MTDICRCKEAGENKEVERLFLGLRTKPGIQQRKQLSHCYRRQVESQRARLQACTPSAFQLAATIMTCCGLLNAVCEAEVDEMQAGFVSLKAGATAKEVSLNTSAAPCQ